MATILVLEKDPIERNAQAVLLEFAGHHCETAACLEEALVQLYTTRIDVLIAGYPHLRNRTGNTDELRALFPYLPVILLANGRMFCRSCSRAGSSFGASTFENLLKQIQELSQKPVLKR